jgi:galactokinase
MRLRRNDALKVIRDGPYRLEQAIAVFRDVFQEEPTVLVSAPGRSEIIGNHTDHNNGRVVAAAIDLDTIVVAGPSPDGTCRLRSAGWDTMFTASQSDTADADGHDTERLMSGVMAGLQKAGHAVPAYQAVLDSKVLPGSGLSSSAALEMSLIGIHEALSEEEVSPVERARIGQFAENEYINKPSGLMDQMAVSVGGCVAIDFSDKTDVRYHSMDLDFHRSNHQLVVVNTGGSHADLTDHYASIPREMNALARVLGVEHLAQTSKKHLLGSLTKAREEAGDRAVLRGLHFFDEQDRVSALIDAADSRRDDLVLAMMNESGDSSWTLLQNVTVPEGAPEQSLALALALTKEYFRARQAVGACRVHGGGFAGTILAVVPEDLFPEYRTIMDRTFGDKATMALNIRREGLVYGTL